MRNFTSDPKILFRIVWGLEDVDPWKIIEDTDH